MNPLTNVKNINKLNDREAELGIGSKSSWHQQYSDSAYLFIGGLPYDLSEGDIICVFSQYGEIVNINLVRDKKSGKSKGFCFIAYEDQRSTILAVDNLNGIKLLGRTLRVDHVAEYRKPKEDENEDDITQRLRQEGCAPRTPSPSPPPPDVEEDDALTKQKAKKAKKKAKKEKKKKKKKKASSSDNSDSSDGEDDAAPKRAAVKREKLDIKTEQQHPSSDNGRGKRHDVSPPRRERDSGRDRGQRDMGDRDGGQRDRGQRDMGDRDSGNSQSRDRDAGQRDRERRERNGARDRSRDGERKDHRQDGSRSHKTDDSDRHRDYKEDRDRNQRDRYGDRDRDSHRDRDMERDRGRDRGRDRDRH